MIPLQEQNVFQIFILAGAILGTLLFIWFVFISRLERNGDTYLILFVFSLSQNNLSNYLIDI
jgi:hypothetical protein